MNTPSALIPNDETKSLAVNTLTRMFDYTYLEGVASTLPILIGMKLETYSDHEFAPVITQTVRDKRVFIMQYVHGAGERFQQLLFTIDAAKRCSAEKVVVILPYYPFCRQDKTMNKRTSLGARLIAKQLEAAGADSVICFDPHAAQIQGFFNIPVDMIGGLMIFEDYLKDFFAKHDPSTVTFVSPDEGGTKRTKKFKEAYPGTSMVMIDKSRAQANVIDTMTLIGDVRDKHCVINDDIVDTAGTLCRAAALLMEQGAKSVIALITHPVLSGKAYENINNSVLEELVVSDTIPIERTYSSKIRVSTIAPALARVMLRITNSQSISEINA